MDEKTLTVDEIRDTLEPLGFKVKWVCNHYSLLEITIPIRFIFDRKLLHPLSKANLADVMFHHERTTQKGEVLMDLDPYFSKRTDDPFGEEKDDS